MPKFREKIIDALLENSKLALFEHHSDPECASEAAEIDHRAAEKALEICFPDDGYGDGAMQRIRSKYYRRYAKRINEITGKINESD